jgi:hypothetical protein
MLVQCVDRVVDASNTVDQVCAGVINVKQTFICIQYLSHNHIESQKPVCWPNCYYIVRFHNNSTFIKCYGQLGLYQTLIQCSTHISSVV